MQSKCVPVTKYFIKFSLQMFFLCLIKHLAINHMTYVALRTPVNGFKTEYAATAMKKLNIKFR